MNNCFCVLPWYSQELGLENTPCCLLPHNHNINQIKQDLLSGVQTAACKKCWDIESTGNKSRRQFENEFLDYKLNRDLDKIQQDCVDSKHQILLYQITTSNLCNQACVSCDSGASTKWAQVEKRMNIISAPQYQFNLDSANINYDSAERISLLGGEPLFDPKTFEILQNLIDHNNTSCFISLITNGSIHLNAKQINLLTQFTNLNICIFIFRSKSLKTGVLIAPAMRYLRLWYIYLILLRRITLCGRATIRQYHLRGIGSGYRGRRPCRPCSIS